MGKTYKRNQYRKPKQHGHVFEKKEKNKHWKKNPQYDIQNPIVDFPDDIPPEVM